MSLLRLSHPWRRGVLSRVQSLLFRVLRRSGSICPTSDLDAKVLSIPPWFAQARHLTLSLIRPQGSRSLILESHLHAAEYLQVDHIAWRVHGPVVGPSDDYKRGEVRGVAGSMCAVLQLLRHLNADAHVLIRRRRADNAVGQARGVGCGRSIGLAESLDKTDLLVLQYLKVLAVDGEHGAVAATIETGVSTLTILQ